MSVNYATHFNTQVTPQTRPIPGRSDMVKNNQGGFVFETGKWKQMLRFLILGSEGGTYHVNENKLSAENAANTVECIREDAQRAVDLIVDVSLNGRAAKQDAVIFALALACTKDFSSEKNLPIAYAAISKVCRTGTHIFKFTNYIKSLRKWSRGLRTGISRFYTDKPLDKLEYQLIKYRQREGYTHKDVMRLAHPNTKDGTRNSLFKYAVGKMDGENAGPLEFKEFSDNFSLIGAYEDAKRLDPKSPKDAIKMAHMISDYNMPREAIPTGFLGNEDVWSALLVNMPIGALVRNLGKLSSMGMTKSNMSDATLSIVKLLNNPEAIRKSRIHPMQLLTALMIYNQGQGDRGSLSWIPNTRVSDAVGDAFYTSFGNVKSTGLRNMIAMDVSGSMSMSKIMGSPLTPRQASAALAMLTARTEPNHDIVAFTSGGFEDTSNGRGVWGSGIRALDISPRDRLQTVIEKVSRLPFRGTDCALPMIYATKNKIPVDVFQITTDNETSHGNIHPKQALDQYRQKMGIDAKLVVMGMTASRFTIADPTDSGMLDVVGFDTATPNIISEFALGNL